MKIFQVMAGARNGGAESFFLRLVSALQSNEFDQIAIIRSDKARAQALEKAKVPVKQFPFGGKLDIYTPYRLKQLAHQVNPDIILSWMNRASGMLPVGRWLNIGRLGGYYNLEYYRKCDHLICNTKDIYSYVINQGRAAEKTHYISNFVDEKIIPAADRSAFDTPVDAHLVLTAGRLHENKGMDTLIRAVEKNPGIFLWIAGEGPLKNKLMQLVRSLSMEGRVRFLGWRNDINALHAAADIFVCASRHEPLGNVVLEGWAQKTPVIATLSQGPKQLVQNGINGMLVPVDDHVELANSIMLLFSDEGLRKSIMENGYQTYMKNFSREVILNQYKNLFLELTQ